MLRMIVMGALGVALVLIFDFDTGEWFLFCGALVGLWVLWRIFLVFGTAHAMRVRAEQKAIQDAILYGAYRPED